MPVKPVDLSDCWQLAPSGLVVLDEQGRILQVNDTLRDWIGRTEKQMLNRPASELFTAEARLLYQGVLVFRLSDVGAVDEVHLSLHVENGNPFPVLCSARRIDSPAPPITLIAMLPIARKDQLERDLLEARQAAQCALAEKSKMIRELESMRSQLESHNQELQRLTLKLGHEARSDPLTGLPNRRHFDLALEERLARAFVSRHSDAFSVAILDIDHFKPINDTHGHAVGDQVLQELALLLASQMRGSDLAARIGGEEFALLMPETSLEEAYNALERLRQAIEAHTWQPVPITASVGVTGYLADDTNESLMARADRALYKAKHLGRNHVAKG
ncbi:MAG: diguanylate cyclase [Halomonas sp.]|nr:diguanylate cyclase [Halomonas sp.]MDP3534731.1 diguanylate cyclase [Halomonas sp.]